MSHARQSFTDVECEIRQLMYRMTAFYDDQQYDSMLALFTEDAVYKSPSRGELHGKAEILAGISRRPRTRLVRHLLSNICVDRHSDDSASSRCYLLGAINDQGHPLVKAVPSVGAPAFGEYLMQFRREDGRWRISRKETIEVFHGQTVHF